MCISSIIKIQINNKKTLLLVRWIRGSNAETRKLNALKYAFFEADVLIILLWSCIVPIFFAIPIKRDYYPN